MSVCKTMPIWGYRQKRYKIYTISVKYTILKKRNIEEWIWELRWLKSECTTLVRSVKLIPDAGCLQDFQYLSPRTNNNLHNRD